VTADCSCIFDPLYDARAYVSCLSSGVPHPLPSFGRRRIPEFSLFEHRPRDLGLRAEGTRTHQPSGNAHGNALETRARQHRLAPCKGKTRTVENSSLPGRVATAIVTLTGGPPRQGCSRNLRTKVLKCRNMRLKFARLNGLTLDPSQ
jgi:hypothetical protein